MHILKNDLILVFHFSFGNTSIHVSISCRVILWTLSQENLILLHVNNKGAYQPAHLRSLISAFVVCYLESIVAKRAT